MKLYKIAKKENWYSRRVAENPNTSPDILKKILERGKNDWVSQFAAQNPNCPPDALKMVLERGNNDRVSQSAVQNPNCSPDALKMVLERGKDDWVSQDAAGNSNCPPELLKMVLERSNNDFVSCNAAQNPNCPPLARILWMRATGQIGKEDPSKHIIEYEKEKVDTDLQKLRELRDMASNKNWYKIAKLEDIPDNIQKMFGLGKYQPKTKYHKCPKCGNPKCRHREMHPDTDINEIVEYCPNCGELTKEAAIGGSTSSSPSVPMTSPISDDAISTPRQIYTEDDAIQNREDLAPSMLRKRKKKKK